MADLSGTRSSKGSLILVAACLTSGLAAVCTYSFVLGCFFTGTDTFTLIETGRFSSFHDVARIVSEPLMAGTRFTEVGKFYRPLSSLSYGMDYSLWKLNPFGYHLTNLLLHFTVTALLVLVMWSLSEGDWAFAWLTGIVFAIHPVLAESVPAIDRRHDAIAAVFLLLSLLLFLRGRRFSKHKLLYLAFSLVSYGLALGGKEIALILPPLIFAHRAVFDHSPSLLKRLRSGVESVAPYVLLTSAYMFMRLRILGGIGGYCGSESPGASETLTYGLTIVQRYIKDLLYPEDFMHVVESSSDVRFMASVALIIAGYLFLFMVSDSRQGSCQESKASRGVVWYLLIWMTLPLALFLMTLTFSHRSMYTAVIPFSGLIAYPVVRCARILLAEYRERACSITTSEHRWSFFASKVAVIAFGGAVFLSLLEYSPLMRDYGAWEESANISSMLLLRTTDAARKLPIDGSIMICNLPDGFLSHETSIPSCKEAAYLQDYSIKSWLRLCDPRNCMKVILKDRSCPWKFTGHLEVSMRQVGFSNLWVYVKCSKPSRRGQN